MKVEISPRISLLALLLTCISACSENTQNDGESTTIMENSTIMSSNAEADMSNPFFSISTLPLQYPPFDQITTEHYLPAFEKGMADHLAEIEVIVNQTEAPSFENTLMPLELSGQLLDRVSTVFFSLSSAHTNDAINEIEVEVAPRLSAHSDQILLNAGLFARIEDLYQRRDSLGLDAEALRLVEENYKDFVRAGAQLDSEQKEQLTAINLELAELSTRFSQNVLEEVNAMAIVVDSAEELAGLTEAEIQAAADEAEARELPGKFVIPLLNTSGQPVMASLDNRALRQRIHETSMSRGHRGGEFDNREIVSRTARLRAEKARLLGFDTHADYILQNQTAQTVAAVNQRL